MNKEKHIIKWLAVFTLVILGAFLFVYYTNARIIAEQELQIEQLQERNATLQQERDEAYEDYTILRDQLWNLNNSLERECAQ